MQVTINSYELLYKIETPRAVYRQKVTGFNTRYIVTVKVLLIIVETLKGFCDFY